MNITSAQYMKFDSWKTDNACIIIVVDERKNCLCLLHPVTATTTK